MPRIRQVKRWTMGHDNKKLGPEIPFWNLPAGRTCVGSTQVCRGCCYVKDGKSQQFVHCRCHLRNLKFSKTNDFVPELSAAILHENPPAPPTQR